MCEPTYRIPLVAHCTALIVLEVVLGMVHTHMVRPIGLWTLAEERGKDPWNDIVECTIAFAVQWSVGAAVHHQPEGALEIHVVQVEVHQCDGHPEPTGNEGHVQQHGQGHHEEGHLQREVGEGKVPFVPQEAEEEPVDVTVFNVRVVYGVRDYGKWEHRGGSGAQAKAIRMGQVRTDRPLAGSIYFGPNNIPDRGSKDPMHICTAGTRMIKKIG